MKVQAEPRPINKVGAIILKDDRLLVVRKHVKDRAEFIIPGGKPEGNETTDQTLKRELQEELGVEILRAEYFGSFADIAVFENVPIAMEVYITEIEGVPAARSEIKEAVWIDRYYMDKGLNVGSVLSEHVIPLLIERGLM